MQSLVKIVDGDICNAKEKYIVHQCNCVSKGARGVAQTIFKKFPYSNVYAQRTKHDVPGTIKICGNGVDKRFIIALFGQYGWGKPDNKNDSPEKRLNFFKSGLGKIAQIPNLESVAFPYLVGCASAGGNWELYLQEIETFAAITQVPVVLYRYNP
ncbi:SNF2 subfamily protein [Histomonas meleagridis]|uniref:SNF2 subfamily protein n=1 Tax=Histomonas meleagridis TaxID=135588 RepID=UPI003559A5F3|nr:SNF2 subfamily protein [Histomonas meleagridis]KAH0803160.1 SNF2 subfamily protein [Histomonas meleagridis]